MTNKVRIAAMADLHTQQNSFGTYRQIFTEISQKADILLLCGDLTHNGLIKEAEVLAEELTFCQIPILGVLGNHDHTNNKEVEIKSILSEKGLFILEDQPFIFQEIGFTGVKGFAGGFDKYQTAPYGESVLKEFVYEAVKEVIKLEESLMRLETNKKIVVLHYSPIRQTVLGESLEVYPMLGTSRLAEPLESFDVTAVFHGHAHHGSLEGKTNKGIPVYNVSFPLLSKLQPNQPYKLIEV